jgi:outer membrane protein assembly factor BamB
MTRFGLSLVAAVLVAVSLAARTATLVPTATLPSTVEGYPLTTFAVDREHGRLYAGSLAGLFWVDLSETRPVWKGPIFKKDIRHIEYAPELDRVFYLTRETVGYAPIDNLSAPRQIAEMRGWDLAYEPTKRQIYVTSRAPKVDVFDAASGEPTTAVPLPGGWFGLTLEAVPGQVFLEMGAKQGLYTIDAATHALKAFRIDGKVVTPAYLEADPAGGHVFAAYDRSLVAIDIATGGVAGRVDLPSTPAIAFDPGSNMLMAVWADEPTPVRVASFRIDNGSLTRVEELENPTAGRVGVEPTNNGFIQNGQNRLYLWTQK